MKDINYDELLKLLDEVPTRRNQMVYHAKAFLKALEDLSIGDTEQAKSILIAAKRLIRRTYPAVGTPGAQAGEDKILSELLPSSTGCYVDIGAADPVECSNTWQFYQRGWRGLLIEPLPDFWPALLQQRRGDYLLGLAAWDSIGMTRLRVSRSVSSIRPDWDIDSQSELVVLLEPMSEILESFPHQIRETCKLCSIDVEGSEREVLRGIDWKTFKPEVFVVEYRRYKAGESGEDLSPEWAFLLTDHGYKEFARTALNVIYRRADLPPMELIKETKA